MELKTGDIYSFGNEGHSIVYFYSHKDLITNNPVFIYIDNSKNYMKFMTHEEFNAAKPMFNYNSTWEEFIALNNFKSNLKDMEVIPDNKPFVELKTGDIYSFGKEGHKTAYFFSSRRSDNNLVFKYIEEGVWLMTSMTDIEFNSAKPMFNFNRTWKEFIALNNFKSNFKPCGSETVSVVNARKELRCDCGAKHTSFPKHHLDWCELKTGVILEDSDSKPEKIDEPEKKEKNSNDWDWTWGL